MTVGFDKSAVDSGAADKSAVDKHTEELIDESLHEKQKQPDGLVSTNSRRMAGLLVCLVVLAAVLLLSIAVGSKTIPFGTVIDALVNYDDSNDHVIIRDLRLPRTLLGLIVGMALGVAGGLIQAMTRNPLADPGILGVNAGAGFAMVVAVAVFGLTSIWSYIWFAFLGAVIATAIVYTLGSIGRGGATPIRLTACRCCHRLRARRHLVRDHLAQPRPPSTRCASGMPAHSAGVRWKSFWPLPHSFSSGSSWRSRWRANSTRWPWVTIWHVSLGANITRTRILGVNRGGHCCAARRQLRPGRSDSSV